MNLNDLNKPQMQAVIHRGSPLMVIAGAGSGKTRTLTHRVAYMIKDLNYLPNRLFVTTFTNKAAEEMKERLVPMIGERRAERLRIGTFHSLCRRILIDLMERNSEPPFSTPKLLKGGSRFFKAQAWFGKAKLDTKQTKVALKKISWWKNEAQRPQHIKKFVEDFEAKKKLDPKLSIPVGFDDAAFYLPYYEVYEEHRADEEYIDYDDMLYQTYWKLVNPKNAKFLTKLQNKIDHILVDEGQDLNRVQFLLTKILAGSKKEVTLVADDWQVLYGFRGALIDHFLDFKEWLQPEVIKLEENYRSTQQIVEMGNRLIKHNTKQIEKTLYTKNEEGEVPEVLMSMTADAEAEQVFNKINDLITENGHDLNDFAILYRTNAQSRAMVDILIKNQVPHKVHAPFGFYDRAEVKDVIAYIRICANPYEAEMEDFQRVINRPTRYLGRKFIDATEEYMIDHTLDTFWEAIVLFVQDPQNELGTRQRNAAMQFVADITKVNTYVVEQDTTTAGLIQKFLDTIPYQEWLEKEDQDEEEPDNNKKLNVDAIMDGAKRFGKPDEFLMFIDSMQDIDEDEDDVVHLMTIHKSKGLEYPVIFLLGCCTRLMPHHLAEDEEEERRAAYVAVTRAKERLYLSSIHGKYGRYRVSMSHFLKEMGANIPHTIYNEEGGVMMLSSSPRLGVVGEVKNEEVQKNING